MPAREELGSSSFRDRWQSLLRAGSPQLLSLLGTFAPWLIESSVEHFVETLKTSSFRSGRMDYPPPIDRHSIVEISHSFHRQAGTETTPVRDNLEAYGRGVTSGTSGELVAVGQRSCTAEDLGYINASHEH
jgi:hypothetical protein